MCRYAIPRTSLRGILIVRSCRVAACVQRTCLPCIARGPSLNRDLVALDLLSPSDVRRAKPRSGLKAHHPGGNEKGVP